VPSVAFPPAIPFTDHVQLFPATEGMNPCADPTRTEASAGESAKACVSGEVRPGGVNAQLALIMAKHSKIAAEQQQRTVTSWVRRWFDGSVKPVGISLSENDWVLIRGQARPGLECGVTG
jgi:hypothetical protein